MFWSWPPWLEPMAGSSSLTLSSQHTHLWMTHPGKCPGVPRVPLPPGSPSPRGDLPAPCVFLQPQTLGLPTCPSPGDGRDLGRPEDISSKAKRSCLCLLSRGGTCAHTAVPATRRRAGLLPTYTHVCTILVVSGPGEGRGPGWGEQRSRRTAEWAAGPGAWPHGHAYELPTLGEAGGDVAACGPPPSLPSARGSPCSRLTESPKPAPSAAHS